MPAEEHVGVHGFECLVREHQAGLRAFIRALGADKGWVDDLAQDAFIVAYRRLKDHEAGADFGKWLRGIARNLVANERRKTARRSRLLPFALADVLLNQGCTSDTPLTDLDELLPALRECVGHPLQPPAGYQRGQFVGDQTVIRFQFCFDRDYARRNNRKQPTQTL